MQNAWSSAHWSVLAMLCFPCDEFVQRFHWSIWFGNFRHLARWLLCDMLVWTVSMTWKTRKHAAKNLEPNIGICRYSFGMTRHWSKKVHRPILSSERSVSLKRLRKGAWNEWKERFSQFFLTVYHEHCSAFIFHPVVNYIHSLHISVLNTIWQYAVVFHGKLPLHIIMLP